MAASSPRPRAREIGLRPGRLTPGQHNGITDLPGVRVGQVSLIEGDAVRTGVTALFTHGGDPFLEKTPATPFVLNGFGKMAGLAQVAELGVVETPIVLTNTLSVPTGTDALIGWTLDRHADVMSVNPVVGECNDGFLNDIRGRHVRVEHVRAALDAAAGGPLAEGAVGAGVGMSCYGFKGGIGTASRRVELPDAAFVVGALVLANFGRREELRIDGVPLGQALAGDPPLPPGEGRGEGSSSGPGPEPSSGRSGSVIVLIGTDAPLDGRQLGRVARRGGLGLARTGSTGGHGSGDFILAFSNAEPIPHRPPASVLTRRTLAEDGPAIDLVFAATAEAVEEAVLNALFRAETLVGREGHRRDALPLEETLAELRRAGRLLQS
ncbi:MAG TPA: P1 family peptidase [Chloroflexota bacterium]